MTTPTLPPLPEPFHDFYAAPYSADQMRAYARAALAQPVPDAAIYAATSERTSPDWHAGFRAGLSSGMACAQAASGEPAIHWPQVVAYGFGWAWAWVDISTGDGPEHVQRFHAAAHPQPVPLTDAQIDEVTLAQWGPLLGSMNQAHRAYARAVLAAAGIVPAPTTGEGQQ